MLLRTDRLFLALASLCLILGVGLGMMMGMRQDFTLAPVHGHLNLVGWVSLALFGLAYRAYPGLGSRASRRWHVALSASGGVLLPIGLAIDLLKGITGPVALASLLWLAGALVFCASIIRLTLKADAAT